MPEKEKVPRYLADSSKLVHMQIDNPSNMGDVERKANISKVEQKVKEFATTLDDLT